MSYGVSTEGVSPSGSFAKKILWIVVLILIVGIVLYLITTQVLRFWLNLAEFGELYVRPISVEFVGGFLLAFVALFRFDFRNRRSIAWWIVRLLLGLIRSRGFIEAIPPEYFEFNPFRLPPLKFFLWQITKVIMGVTFFSNINLGLALIGVWSGWDAGITDIWKVFLLPFITPPENGNYVAQNLLPMAPVLTMILPPLIGSIGARLVVLVGLTEILRVFTSFISDASQRRYAVVWRIAVLEGLISLGLFWTMINFFFPTFIDYNTKVFIAGLAVLGSVFAVYAVIDRRRRSYWLPNTRTLMMRFSVVLIILLSIASMSLVQNNVADARKVEWLGPYRVQQIAVNSFLADLDEIVEVPYDFQLSPLSLGQMDQYVREQRFLLDRVRLWDRNATEAKLKPQIGLIPYIGFQDMDILRFNGTLYWSASMKPILPSEVRVGDRWYAEHLFYTHVPEAFLVMDGNSGVIQDAGRFFKQRKTFYGEGGLLSNTWAGYPIGRKDRDVGGEDSYGGKGGIKISPPLTWLFGGVNFLSYWNSDVHILRYRDIHERMQLLFPYFEYGFNRERLDIFPVSDGKKTYWLMPLIVSLGGDHLPWSAGNSFRRLVGYALIDIFDGNTQIILLGNDYFTQLFRIAYRDIPGVISTEVPDWLKNQTRYPEELFEWRVAMYNFYHVKDPSTFITARDFYFVPEGLDTYYILSQPPGFDRPEFVGLLSLELRGALGRNLVGYMIVKNDYPQLGKMVFFKIPESETKLLGPSAIREALERDPDFAKLRTLLRSPRVGDNILYRIGKHDVYVIPVYTSAAGGVVTQIGTIATVGAAFTGKYFVGLGSTVEESFRNYLQRLSATDGLVIKPIREDLMVNITKVFSRNGIEIIAPREIVPNVSFIEGNVTYTSPSQWPEAEKKLESFIAKWMKPFGMDRALLVVQGDTISLGALINVRGVVELHIINVTLR